MRLRTRLSRPRAELIDEWMTPFCSPKMRLPPVEFIGLRWPAVNDSSDFSRCIRSLEYGSEDRLDFMALIFDFRLAMADEASVICESRASTLADL